MKHIIWLSPSLAAGAIAARLVGFFERRPLTPRPLGLGTRRGRNAASSSRAVKDRDATSLKTCDGRRLPRCPSASLPSSAATGQSRS